MVGAQTLGIRRRAKGVMLLTVMLFIGVSMLAASSLVVVHTRKAQRENEEQLLFAGRQYRAAIAAYYNTIPPGRARALPPSLEALVNDDRFPQARHHLRRLYPDPMTGRADWRLVREGNGIIGVASSSQVAPMKRGGFAPSEVAFAEANAYADWIFSVRR